MQVSDDGVCTVTITPTYSGCPAMQVIAESVTEALHGRGVSDVKLLNQLSPAWTTDWMSDAGKAKLKGYGIAPPAQQVIDISGLRSPVSRKAQPKLTPEVPLDVATSNHSGGVNVCMADGSVRFIKDSVNMNTWWALGSKAGGEVIDASSY